MPPKSPLPQRNGLDAAWMRTPDRDLQDPKPWETIGGWIEYKLGEVIPVAEYFSDERFVYQNGAVARPGDAYQANTFVWFHRDLKHEAEVPGEIITVYEDDRIIIIDKPPFLATIPRGKHVLQSVVAKLRVSHDLQGLTPAHRLDRLTSGLLILTKEKRWRGPYQMLFQNQSAVKTYEALAPATRALSFPLTFQNHLHKTPGEMRVKELDGLEPNAISIIDLKNRASETATYSLKPLTGKTHQLRQHMMRLGIPIKGDPLYPDEKVRRIDDFSEPLQLLARELTFTDPVDGSERLYKSERTLPIKGSGEQQI